MAALFVVALAGGLVFAVYRRKVAARNAQVINDLQKRVGMHVDNPMYEAAATPALSLEPNVKGKLVDVPDSEYEEAIGVARNRHVFIESTKESDCTSGGNSADGGGSSGSSTAASGIVFAIPMDEEYLDVEGAAVAEVAVVEPTLPHAAGGAAVDLLQPGSTASMRSIVLQGFSVPMQEEQDAEGEQEQEQKQKQKQQLEDAEDALPPLALIIPMEVTDDDSTPPPLPRKERYTSVC